MPTGADGEKNTTNQIINFFTFNFKEVSEVNC